MNLPERELTFRCGFCETLSEFRGEYNTTLVVLCGRCKKDITRDFKRAFFRDVAADINARIVERENREFLRYLAAGWPPKDSSKDSPKG